MSLEHVVGTATVISSLAGRFIGYPAQIRLILKTRMVSNLSITLHGIGFVSCLLWTWHGWLNGDWVILLTQGLAGIAATGSMLFLIWRFRPRRVARESLAEVLVTLSALDGAVHPDERDEVDVFARTWDLPLDWDRAEAVVVMPAQKRQDHLQAELRRYLSQRPPVAQLRELRDLAWVVVQADGAVTDDERRAASNMQALLGEALVPFGDLESILYRVVVLPKPGAETAMPPGLVPHGFRDQRLWMSEVALAESIARQHSAELRKAGWLAMTVTNAELA